MGEPQKHTEWKKPDLKEWIHTVWFYLQEVQEQVKVIYGDKNQKSGYLWGQGLLTGKGTRELSEMPETSCIFIWVVFK